MTDLTDFKRLVHDPFVQKMVGLRVTKDAVIRQLRAEVRELRKQIGELEGSGR